MAATCVLSGLTAATAVAATTVTFTSPGTHAFMVPANVTSIMVAAVGAAGGDCPDVSTGGRGAGLTATVAVSPGESLSAQVGGVGGVGCNTAGDVAGGTGGGGAGGDSQAVAGGGGGGASGIGPGALAAGASPLLVAAGGGGAGFCTAGGDAGAPGQDAAGNGCDEGAVGSGGGAGITTAGGAGGVAGDSNAGAGANGTPGTGGNGGFGDTTAPSSGGGGGGGGYYGGGGGGGSAAFTDGGGGGGGSSFAAAGATGVIGPAPTSANPSVTITYTAQPAPAVTTGVASAITTAAATVGGTVNPEGLATTYHFEYGTSTAYGSSTASVSAGSGGSNVSASASLTGLNPGTTYHFRLVATNASGTTDGADATFTTTTPPSTPKPSTPKPSIKVHPSTVFAGKLVRVFGSAGGCAVGDSVTLISKAFSHAHNFAGIPAVFANVHSNGTYSTTTKIPASRAAGTYTITARCGGGNFGVHARLRVRRHHVVKPVFTG